MPSYHSGIWKQCGAFGHCTRITPRHAASWQNASQAFYLLFIFIAFPALCVLIAAIVKARLQSAPPPPARGSPPRARVHIVCHRR